MMMIGAVVVAILVVAAGAFFVLSGKSTGTQEANVAEDSQMTDESMMEGKSIKDLMAFKGNQQCTFADTEGGSSGTVYVGGGKMRGDFESVSDATTINSHMISDAEYVYVWTDGQTSGFKMLISDMEKMNESADTTTPKTVDVDKRLDYDCSSWSVDNTKFTAPTNVKFTDTGAMMNEAMEGMEKPEGLDSSVCNQITEAAAKAACLKTLGQ